MTDDEKLNITRFAFMNKLNQIYTWTDFKTMISQITKTKVKNFIVSNLENAEQGYIDAATYDTTMATDVDSLITEVDSL